MRRLESLAEDAGSFDAYLREIARFPEIPVDEERVLASRIQERDDRALSQLVGAHLSMVVRYARRFRQIGVPLLDLVHDGNLALIDAARRFDPDRHPRFAAYALWWVRQGILHRMALAPAPPAAGEGDVRTGQMVAALGAAVDHACSQAGARSEDASPGDLRGLGAHWRMSDPDIMEETDPVDVDDLATGLPDRDGDALRVALHSDLEASLLELEPKERRALQLRLGLIDGEPRSLEQIGDRLRVSPARAGRLSTRAVRKLRRQRSVRSALN